MTRNGLPIVFVILTESARSFLKNRGFDVGAALSAYGFFALIPLLFFIAYLLGTYVVSSQLALQGINRLITHLFPPLTPALMHEIGFLTSHKATWGGFSLLMLLVSIIPFMDQLRSAFSGIFRTEGAIPFVRSQLLNVVAVVVALGLFVLLVTAEMLYGILLSRLPAPPALSVGVLDLSASFLITAVLVLTFYGTLIPSPVTKRYLVVASLVSAFLLLCFGALFSSFLVSNPEYGLAFGSLKAIGTVIFWIYCSFLVLLFGAEVMVALNKRDALLLRRLFLSDAPLATGTRRLFGRFLKTYAEGDVLVREGTSPDTMFYILEGTVTINKNGHVISRMGRGDYFGEMSMLLDSLASATVVASERLEVALISRANLEIILKENPDVVMRVLKEMASRLKATSEHAT